MPLADSAHLVDGRATMRPLARRSKAAFRRAGRASRIGQNGMRVASGLSMRCWTLVVVTLLTACGESQPPGPEGVDAGRSLILAWQTCSVDVADGGPASCATPDVPARWTQPDRGTLSLWLKKVPSRQATRAQLWLLQGGPGGSSRSFEAAVSLFQDKDPGLEIYLLDHRGTGRSTRLSCPSQEADDSEAGVTMTEGEWQGCITHLRQQPELLEALTVTEAARDLGELIAATRRPNVDVFVYGVSYGTAWAQRYLQLYPAQATGVVLDSIVSPLSRGFADYDRSRDKAARDLLASCKLDALCRSRLGPEPLERALALMERIENGHCNRLGAAPVVRSGLRRLFSSLLDNWYLRVLLPALVYRLERCSDGDIQALNTLMSVMGRPRPASERRLAHSEPLFMHIGISEFWPDEALEEKVLVAEEASRVASAGFSLGIAHLSSKWPRVPRGTLSGQFAVTEVPMLMLNGSDDAATPPEGAREVAAHFAKQHQHFYELPSGTHGSLLGSPVASPGAPSCGVQLMLGFLQAPRAPKGHACLGNLQKLTFDPPSSFGIATLGRASIWDEP
jgi:pimeloyl-ACP methyl ester carboxylesterase